jgi:hypothetical protein
MEGKYTEPRLVHSEGEIEAKVWYTESEKIYYMQEQFEQTGQEENKYSIKLNNFQINFNKRVSKFEFYDTIETENKLKIFSNFYLPISILKITNKETNRIQKTYTKEEAKQLGIQELQLKIEEQIDENANILRKKCKYI